MEYLVSVLSVQRGGTEFVSRPERLWLGGRSAENVDELAFTLPAEWAGKNILLYIERGDGSMAPPIQLDAQGKVPVSRAFTQTEKGRWMLTALDDTGYHACTRPGSYCCYSTLSTDAEGEEIPPSLYEQFVQRVLSYANSAANAAQRAEGNAAAAARSEQAATAVLTGIHTQTNAATEAARQAADSATAAGTSAVAAAASEQAAAAALTSLQAQAEALTAQLTAALLARWFPVGSCWWTTEETEDPAQRLGGSWAKQSVAGLTCWVRES